MNTKDALDAFGSVKQLADGLGISVQAVYSWGDKVPPLRAYQIRDLLAARRTEATISNTLEEQQKAA